VCRYWAASGCFRRKFMTLLMAKQRHTTYLFQ
jgi:hypothetical protein